MYCNVVKKIVCTKCPLNDEWLFVPHLPRSAKIIQNDEPVSFSCAFCVASRQDKLSQILNRDNMLIIFSIF